MSLMRIDDLFHFEKGILQSSKCTEGEFDFITASSQWKTHNEYTHDCEALVFAAAASGSLGRTHYVNGKFISSDLCFIITAKDPIKLPIDLKFYHMIFNEFKNDIVNSTKAGTSKEAIGMKAFGNYKLPYFAINKQIDTKVQFVNMQDSKVELNVELTHQLNLIKQLRQAFLREAMQGKLVNSTNIKETGQQLLSKIKTEKAQLIAEKKLKKEKELAPISEDEIPFEIPEHWAWCRLGAICIMNYGKGLTKAECFDNGNYPVFGSNGIVGYYDNFLTEKKSIIIGRKGSAGALNISLQPSWTTDVAYFIEENDNLNFLFLNYLLKSLKLEEIGKGIKPGLNRNEAYNIIIGLPPHHEQELIVAKLKELMTFCDGLEQSIKESQGYNEQLLQQVLREALRKDPVGLV